MNMCVVECDIGLWYPWKQRQSVNTGTPPRVSLARSNTLASQAAANQIILDPAYFLVKKKIIRQINDSKSIS